MIFQNLENRETSNFLITLSQQFRNYFEWFLQNTSQFSIVFMNISRKVAVTVTSTSCNCIEYWMVQISKNLQMQWKHRCNIVYETSNKQSVFESISFRLLYKHAKSDTSLVPIQFLLFFTSYYAMIRKKNQSGYTIYILFV